MGAVQDIFTQYGNAYLERFGDAVPAPHRAVMRAVQNCRTPALGVLLYTCSGCGEPHPVPCGCGNRHCPNCQQARAGKGLEKRLAEQLPGPHFLLTVTVPEPLRAFMRANQADTYAALFDVSTSAIRDLAAEPKYVGGDLPGFFGVLHTWGRTLDYHPHIHYVVPGGALDRGSGLWKASRADFFVPVHALSQIIRARFRDRMRDLGVLDGIDPEVWRQDWNVNSQAVGSNTGGVLRYLAAYVFRVAISDSRIVDVCDGRVTFTYRRVGSNRPQRMTLDALEFIRRFLQHVLPDGFRKIRYYGFMAPGCRVPHEQIETMVRLAYAFELPDIQDSAPAAPPPPCCRHCGAPLRFSRRLGPDHLCLVGTA
jgi:hypothetical protein